MLPIDGTVSCMQPFFLHSVLQVSGRQVHDRYQEGNSRLYFLSEKHSEHGSLILTSPVEHGPKENCFQACNQML